MELWELMALPSLTVYFYFVTELGCSYFVVHFCLQHSILDNWSIVFVLIECFVVQLVLLLCSMVAAPLVVGMIFVVVKVLVELLVRAFPMLTFVQIVAIVVAVVPVNFHHSFVSHSRVGLKQLKKKKWAKEFFFFFF